MIASRAGFGPIPLRSGVVDIDSEGGDSRLSGVSWYRLRGMDPAPASKLGGGSAFALRAREGLIASNAGYGPIPLRWRTFC